MSDSSPTCFALSLITSLSPQVCSREEQEILNRGSKKSEKLRNSLMNRGGGTADTKSTYKTIAPSANARMEEGLKKAIEHKEKLLNFDKTR